MSRETGHSFGSRLDTFSLGLAAAAADARRQLAVAVLAAEAAKEHAADALALAVERFQVTQSALTAKEHALELVTSDRDGHASDYSIPRGLFYMAVAILLLAGDLTVLAGVLSEVLGLPFRAQVEVEGGGLIDFWVTDIVNKPALAWSEFRNVIVLTSSVLLLGFFPKLFFDLRLDRMSRTYRFAIYTVLALSVVAVVTTAIARYALPSADRPAASANASATVPADTPAARDPTSGSTGWFGVASVLLGLALPYVSCFFFSIGADKLGRRLSLWRLHAACSRARLARDTCEVARVKADTALTESGLEWSRLASPEHGQQAEAIARSEYSQGYSDGVMDLLRGSGPGTVFAGLQTVAIRRRIA